MENDLISRSELLKKFPPNMENPLWHFTGIRAAIEAAPAVDTVTVVHAHWIKTFNSDGFVSTLRCSECGNAENSTYVPGNFCWFCGARMDAEEKPDAG